MLVMLSNCKGPRVRELWEQFPEQIGHLFAPSGLRDTGWRPPWTDLYALDNGAYGAKLDGRSYPHRSLLRLADRAEQIELEHGIGPLWLACPDVPFEAEPTLKLWGAIAPWFRALYGWPLALCVQDDMTPAQVRELPEQPDVLFVGGSTTRNGRAGWKWDRLAEWVDHFPRVHVGRVNSPEKLWECRELGIESVDGTGWVRGDAKQWAGLVSYLAEIPIAIVPEPEQLELIA